MQRAFTCPPLYLTGGRQRNRRTEEWHQFEKALILRFDARTGAVSGALEYSSPEEVCAGADAAILFKAAARSGRNLYVTTNTEVLVYELPSFRLTAYLSLPYFNDLHYACPARNGNILIANTGLDMVAEVDPDGRPVREWCVLGGDGWERFSRATDYRKVSTTKPHLSHPNFVIEAGEDTWVSRGLQQDVCCLTRPGRRVPFRGHPHDGVKYGGKVYFTTVNGFVHVLDENSMQMEDTVDLNQIGDRETSLGWMRGILPVDEERCWVGFTRFRPTRFRENVSWVRHGFKQFHRPTRVALYDLAAKELLCEVDLEPYGMNAIFSIIPEPVEP